MIYRYFYDLIFVVYNPRKIGINTSEKSSTKTTVFYFIFSLIIFFLINLLITVLDSWFDFPRLSINVQKFSVIRVLLIAPIIEEFCFRSILKKTKFNFSLLLIGLIYIYLVRFVRLDNDFLILAFCSLLFVVSYYYFVKKATLTISPYKNNVTIFLVVFSSFLFGIIHIFNYEISSKLNIILLLVLLPKILLGFLLSMLRLKFGLLYSISFHCFWNFTIYSIYLLNA